VDKKPILELFVFLTKLVRSWEASMFGTFKLTEVFCFTVEWYKKEAFKLERTSAAE
jgi:hypothetical protein